MNNAFHKIAHEYCAVHNICLLRDWLMNHSPPRRIVDHMHNLSEIVTHT